MENAGFSDSYVRKMNQSELSTKLILPCGRVIAAEKLVSYSTVTSILSFTGDSGKTESIATACRFTDQAKT